MSSELDAALTTAAVGSDPAASTALSALIQPDQYVGEVFSIAYETAKVQIHDYQRRQVGGIPALSFLLASRVVPSVDDFDPLAEDSCAILLRVMDAVPLPDSKQAEVTRVETARSVSGEIDRHWDSDSAMDADTRVFLGYAGVGCRILGTFFLESVSSPRNPSSLTLRFGSDISNYYPNRGLKVYKPVGDALKTIVNYVRSDLHDMPSRTSVLLGQVRYASTNRQGQGVDDVGVRIYPADLLTQKTAVFGMTRTGKSNTMKIIAKSIYDLRKKDESLRIGQIVFDSNGEYANENVQDSGALKNVWRTKDNAVCREDEIATYGIVPHPNDDERNLMRLDFYREGNLQVGKQIIDDLMADQSSQYARHFRDVAFCPPDADDWPETIRYRRRVLCYHTLLHAAGFSPSEDKPVVSKLFGKDFLDAMKNAETKGKMNYDRCADILGSSEPSWTQMSQQMEVLRAFLRTEDYKAFNRNRAGKGHGEPWADAELEKILEMFVSPNRPRLVGRALVYHSPKVSEDYADSVYDDLKDGKLVIVDQSTGDPTINRESADRIMRRVFEGNQDLFRKGKEPPHIVIFVEEAHNQLPSDRDVDLRNVWVRTAKEGAKFRIGMVYATQEVSSIQRNMLRNTANWFIGHLNNTDETRELRKYYDFADFEQSILRAQDTGFLRVKTLSNPFVVPVQIRRFDAPPVTVKRS